MRSKLLRASAYTAPSALEGQAGGASIHPDEDGRGPSRRAGGDTLSQAGTLGEAPGHHPRKQEALPNIGI